MSKKIIKINNLTKLQGFLQLDFYKGFKFVDKSGEFLNNFCTDDNIPNHIINSKEMVVKIDDKTQLKASPQHLWMTFLEPPTFDYQKKEFEKRSEQVNTIFEPEKYIRIGWRHYLAYDCGNSYPSIIPNDYLKGCNFIEILFDKKINSFDSRISVSKLVKEGSSQKAILFDIDVFRKEDITRNNYFKINEQLDEMEKVYKSEYLLEIINSLLK